ncbi:MAG: hypothetical protein RR413_06315 [Christensenellaceae bacterium]
MLDYDVLKMGRAISYGSVTLKSLQNDNVPELDLLVREAIQNSSDASLCIPGDSFRVNFATGEFRPSALNFFITGMEDTLNRRFPDETAHFMEIRDTKTEGLTGCIRMGDITGEDHGNFYKLIYDTGKRQIQSGAGGNWGFGKSVYYRVGVGIVIFYSQIKDGNTFKSRLIVTLVEDESKPDALLKALDSSAQGKAWWGIWDSPDLLPLTDEDSDFINELLSVFGISPFKENETGTSIIIPYINPQKLLDDIIPNEAEVRDDVKQNFLSVWGSTPEDYLRLAIQKWYAPKIHNRKLQDFCDNKKWLSVSINNNPIRKTDMLPFFDLVQELYITAIAKTYGSEYHSERFPEIVTQPVNIRSYLDGSTSGYVAIIKITREELANNQMLLSPYDYVGRFEADGGKNEPIVMYTRDPGMVIEYSVTGAWVKNIPLPENENEFLFAFYMPDTRKKIRSDLSVKEYAGKSLGEYLRACEASDHMGWLDPAKMQIVERIQKNTVGRIIDQQKENSEKQVDATASKLSGKLGRLLLPRVGYANTSRSGRGSGNGSGGSGSRLNDLEFDVQAQSFNGNELIVDFSLKLSHGKKNADIAVIVNSEGGRIDPTAWQNDIGTPFPATIEELTIFSVSSSIFEQPVPINEICTPNRTRFANEYVQVEIDHAEYSTEYSSLKVDANILNMELRGRVKLFARDKKYDFSFRTV